MPSTLASERTAVYRIRGEGETLLYIGVTNSVQFRWNGHQAVQPWWDELRSLTVKWYPSRDAALAAEKAAILAEQPKYNVTYLKPGRLERQQKRPARPPVELDAVAVDPRDDDEDLLTLEDVAKMIRGNTSTAARSALRLSGGPPGFRMGARLVFRKRTIRQWIAAVEASQDDNRGIA